MVVVNEHVVLQKKARDPVRAALGSSLGLRYPDDYLDREREDW